MYILNYFCIFYKFSTKVSSLTSDVNFLKKHTRDLTNKVNNPNTSDEIRKQYSECLMV